MGLTRSAWMPVVERRGGVLDDQGSAEDAAGDHMPGITVQGGKGDKNGQAGDG